MWLPVASPCGFRMPLSLALRKKTGFGSLLKSVKWKACRMSLFFVWTNPTMYLTRVSKVRDNLTEKLKGKKDMMLFILKIWKRLSGRSIMNLVKKSLTSWVFFFKINQQRCKKPTIRSKRLPYSCLALGRCKTSQQYRFFHTKWKSDPRPTPPSQHCHVLDCRSWHRSHPPSSLKDTHASIPHSQYKPAAMLPPQPPPQSTTGDKPVTQNDSYPVWGLIQLWFSWPKPSTRDWNNTLNIPTTSSPHAQLKSTS